MKVLSVVGARPSSSRPSPSRGRSARDHEEVLVHTGQHYDERPSPPSSSRNSTSRPRLQPRRRFGHARRADRPRSLAPDRRLVESEDPDAVLVYGDTNSTLASAVVAAKTDARLAHVEAGLRSYNRDMPEEVNRELTDHVSDLLFAPTRRGVENLRKEGVENVHLTGDVMYDAILWARARAAEHSDVLAANDLTDDEYVLATVHRAGNTDDPDRLAAIMGALCEMRPRRSSSRSTRGRWSVSTSTACASGSSRP